MNKSYQVQTRHGIFAYHLIRSRRKTLALHIHQGQLIVKAPLSLSREYIEQFIKQKSDWIATQFYEFSQRASPLMKLVWQDQANIPYLGKQLRLHVSPDFAWPYEYVDANGQTKLDKFSPQEGDTLRIKAPVHASSKEIGYLCEQWYKGMAASFLNAFLHDFCRQHDIYFTKFVLTQAKSRWGSCSSRGVIRLHWQLIFYDVFLIQYVVAHEVAHLQEMNHSPAFWKRVKTLMPNYEKAHETLKKLSILEM
ncbi:M48 family metallopeptidase [Basilea psittacipulmonis]|uniref:YgjP-like metallopeptidase domain-containing protein n=1 Tax=Basilea psittacipulmonis DSM 24701 TaxID=1072685 RepID=A0A077DDQ0_9BURK|nr:SprT family zinc-dependent metalloprotease [Basilea psittacipulmonis]AIL33000.1 hypothetical protein IX83_06450 [Basilea psittacipulmonis DSM 24701]